MGTLKDDIIQIIRNTFKLDNDQSLLSLQSKSSTQSIKGLPELITMVTSEITQSHKIYAMALEHVVVNIKLKKLPSAIEKKFLDQVTLLIDKPMYELDQSEPIKIRPF